MPVPGLVCYPAQLFLELDLASPLPVCPFCKGAVPADTLRFGGNCPHCMLEIPGEEAPTDPGLQARLRKEQEDKAKLATKQRKNRVVGVLSLVGLIGLVGAGGWAWQAQQESLTYEMDDYYATPLSELQAAEAAPLQTAEAPVGGPASGRPNGRKPPGTGPTIGAGNPSGEPGRLRPEDGAGGDAPGPKIEPAVGAGGDVSPNPIKVSFQASDRVLSDGAEIFAMAKAVINASSPQLQGCYNQRLKQVEGLKGAWEVSFTVAEEGTAKNVRVTGVNGSDADLEACMTRAVSTWKFQKIAKDQPVKKTYRFGAGSW